MLCRTPPIAIIIDDRPLTLYAVFDWTFASRASEGLLFDLLRSSGGDKGALSEDLSAT